MGSTVAVKKKKLQPSKPKIHPIDELQETLLKAISEKLGGRSAPGIVMSWLKTKQLFYGSVITYTGSYGEGRTVVFSRMAPTVAGLVEELANELVKESEMDRLKGFL